ncbi:MAG: hypothetical protein GX384_06790 [Clostridiaceae bacterium]|jgi:hypothetical protein|nr:hypothetical protein [Clostridiaceae bacterium]
MFGYVEPDKPELKIREFEVFRGYYCGVCKSIGKRFGQVPRISLNYDLAFLAVLLDSTQGEMSIGKVERCIAHPIRKRYVIRRNQFVDYAADMNIVLAYYNLRDKWSDEKNLLGAFGSMVLRGAYKKASKRYKEKTEKIKSLLDELIRLEKEKCASLDEAAEPFANIMREVFQCPHVEDESKRKVLGWLGYNIGRWIYILDAWDDLADDIKSGSYNAILLQFQYNGGDLDAFKASIKERLDFSLTYSLSECEKAYSLLGAVKNAGIIDNIIYSGLIVKTDKVLQGRCKKNEKESI